MDDFNLIPLAYITFSNEGSDITSLTRPKKFPFYFGIHHILYGIAVGFVARRAREFPNAIFPYKREDHFGIGIKLDPGSLDGRG